jgi:glycosyltransferase involved in cell wall biosynthesis
MTYERVCSRHTSIEDDSNKPLVSIVTNSFNYGSFLEDTLTSVMNQNYPRIEHIVIDGGSTDNTLEILKKYEKMYNLKWVSEPDNGQSNAVNKGFSLSTGDIIGWLDSDDVYLDRLSVSYVVDAFQNRPEVDVVFGNDVLLDENSVIYRARLFPDWDYERLKRRFNISQPSNFFRRRVIEKENMDESLRFAMDLEFFLRIGKIYRFMHIDRLLAGTRVHSHRKSISQKNLAIDENNKVLRKYGHAYGLQYYLRHFLLDFPGTIVERVIGLRALAALIESPGSLAFKGRPVDKRSSILSQFASESLRLRLKRSWSEKYGVKL